ncbi:hypothetical protein V3317_01500 [Mycoplasmopsis felis]|uniref:hypothetical protein n=1 Tax=Mycoplasmopsis felis TaxID=33923 RepID=UPI000AD5AC9C
MLYKYFFISYKKNKIRRQIIILIKYVLKISICITIKIIIEIRKTLDWLFKKA